MKTKQVKPIILIGALIALTCLVMTGASSIRHTGMTPPGHVSNKKGIVTLSGRLVQDKITTGSDGVVSVALSMTADNIPDDGIKDNDRPKNFVDMVIVLDRSGSMNGQKINDAKTAVRELLSRLTPSDRFALVTYSDTAQRVSGLVNVTSKTKNSLYNAINGISAAGGTNLGQGLQTGIDMLTASSKTGNTGRLILISDGLANKGITDAHRLGQMASVSVKKEFSISTAGVGLDFNETLMSAIADQGTGNYYFLENPSAFASVFNNEFKRSRTAAATSVKVSFRGENGIRLIEAGGYPIHAENNTAVFYPGDLIPGETRDLFLSIKIPTDQIRSFDLSKIALQYQYNGTPFLVSLPGPLTLACVKDPEAAMASIDEKTWTQKILQEDFSRLKEAVARDIRRGHRQDAMDKIDLYHSDQETMNARIKSEAVAANLEQDVNELRQTVDDSFSGKPAVAMEKQKKNAKVLQFEGYRDRRKN